MRGAGAAWRRLRPTVALPRPAYSDEALVACAQSFFAAPLSLPSAAAPGAAPLPPRDVLYPCVVPKLFSPVPHLYELSLWDLVRLLKVADDMSGVAGFPHLRAELLLRHARRVVPALHWAQPSAEDAAALHALAVYMADKLSLASASSEGAGAGAAPAGAAPEDAAADDPSRAARQSISDTLKGILSPAIAAVVEARGWPPVAVADVLLTLGARGLLSSAALGALLRCAAAEAPAASLEDALDLLLGLAAAAEGSGATAEGAQEGFSQGAVDAAFRACAGRLAALLVAREEAAAEAAAGEGGAAPAAATPLATLSALALAVAARCDSAGVDAAQAPGNAEQGLAALARAIGTCAVARLQAHLGSDQQQQQSPELQESQQQQQQQQHAEAVVAAQALSIGRCLACMGVWHAPLIGALGKEWFRQWGRAEFSALLPLRAAADALQLASLGAAQGQAPVFPPPPMRLSAALATTREGRSGSGSGSGSGGGSGGGRALLLLMNGLGQGLHQRPLLPRLPQRPSEAPLASAFAAAWEEARARAGGGGGGEAELLRHACSAAAFLTPEGCVLDLAVPGASCGVRIVRASSDFRPGGSGLRASLLAEQSILEAAGWTVEYILESDVAWMCRPAERSEEVRRAEARRLEARRLVRALLAAEAERRGR